MKFDSQFYDFINTLSKFNYTLSVKDHIWDIIFPDQKDKWNHIRCTNYNGVYYLSLLDGELPSLEIKPNTSIEILESFGSSRSYHSADETLATWNNLVISASKWLKQVEKNWIKTNRNVVDNYPLNRRTGIVPSSLIQASIEDIYRIDQELGKTKLQQFIQLVENGYFHDQKKITRPVMSASDYFDYCKIAYTAARRKDDAKIDQTLSGKEMYQRFADGRHNGLLDIDENSPEEFSNWIDGTHPKHGMGGHPWEIKRGGNTTHIDLSVSRPSHYEKEGYAVTLRGQSIGRLKETICMFLAIQKSGLPVTISDPEGIRKRLLAEDNIGIIPCHHSLHRANQHFPEAQDVFDVLHFDDLKRYKVRIKPFITWEPLPILKPVEHYVCYNKHNTQ